MRIFIIFIVILALGALTKGKVKNLAFFTTYAILVGGVGMLGRTLHGNITLICFLYNILFVLILGEGTINKVGIFLRHSKDRNRRLSTDIAHFRNEMI